MVKKLISGVAGKFIYSYLLDMIIDLILDRIITYKNEIDFDKVEADAIKIIRKKINFFFLEEIFIALLKVVLKYAEIVLDDILFSNDVWNLIRENKFKKAAKLLKKLIFKKIKAGA